MTENIEGEEKSAAESKSKGLAGKFWRVFKHICRGLVLVFIVRIGMSFTPSECKYYDENGAEIVQGYSCSKGYASQIEFHKKLYETPKHKEASISKKLGPTDSFWGLHSCAELHDGRILITGNNKDFYDLTDCTWICDPTKKTKVAGPKMPVKCIQPGLTTLKNGKILLTGGFRDDKNGPIDTISIYDPATEKIKEIGKLLQARADHTTLQINSHEVLIAGGKLEAFQLANPGKTTGIAEIIDINTGKSKLAQITPDGSSPFLIRDDKKDIYVIGGFYATKSMGDTRWHGQVTKLNIPRDQVD